MKKNNYSLEKLNKILLFQEKDIYLYSNKQNK